MTDSPGDDKLKTVYDYHDRTKHHLNRYARSLGFMDWANQANPFRRFEGAPLHRLPLPAEDARPTYDSLFFELPPPAPLNAESVSRLFFFGLALSAWKQVNYPDGRVHSRWSLRVDPSSGNLHPTEGYLISGPVEGLSESAAVWHYAPFEHGLELRRELASALPLPAGSLLVGLSSIHWREAWKYGERAFRYCQHDAGHAVGAITFSAACLGWQVQMVDTFDAGALSELLGVHTQEGVEAEHADCLLLLTPGSVNVAPTPDDLSSLSGGEWHGVPNELSASHHPWPVIGEVAEAVRSQGMEHQGREAGEPRWNLSDRVLSAHRIIRQRRSAQSMDGETGMGCEAFYRVMQRLIPSANPMPFAALPWKPAVSLAVFVHRVEGMESGLYMLVRDPAHEDNLRQSFRSEFPWKKPEGCPEGLSLYLLSAADVKDAAMTVSCHQEIASEGAFSLGMLAEFDGALEAGGPAMYPRLFWETGLIGQVLYLEAEAAGIRGTGIGCFFDDAVHQILGVEDHAWQSLYHFTIGGPVDDPRLQTVDAYEHLKVRELQGEAAWREA